MYQNGLGVEKDRDTAYKLYVAAADGGHVQAANNIGCLLLKSTDLPDHRELAKRWFRWGAERGDATAAHNLANAR
jgi:TPR repeat protein